jgi:hypothetical protein
MFRCCYWTLLVPFTQSNHFVAWSILLMANSFFSHGSPLNLLYDWVASTAQIAYRLIVSQPHNMPGTIQLLTLVILPCYQSPLGSSKRSTQIQPVAILPGVVRVGAIETLKTTKSSFHLGTYEFTVPVTQVQKKRTSKKRILTRGQIRLPYLRTLPE